MQITRRYKIFKERLSNEGFNYLKVFFRMPGNYIAKFFKRPYFVYKDRTFRYFYHPHHRTWMTEREIEIPIIVDYIMKSSDSILEIGNVTNHYLNKINEKDIQFIPIHDVVDKYEKGDGVINEDVLTYNPSKKYNLIFSISTMEHVGWDEEIKDENKIINSINNLKSLLTENGKIIITVPINYNAWLDKLIEEGTFGKEMYFMKRKRFNRWIPCTFQEIKKCGFNEDARGLAILEITK